MLVAAEELLRHGGADALTVEAVIERAGTSTGSFYARFGSRRGLYVAMHERFLGTLATTWQRAARDAFTQPTLADALELFFGVIFDAIRRHRDTLHFHMIQNAHDVEMRAQGNEVSRTVFVALVDIVEAHSTHKSGLDLDKLDLVGRALFGLILEIVLFEPHEANGRDLTDQQRAERFTEMVLGYLRDRERSNLVGDVESA